MTNEYFNFTDAFARNTLARADALNPLFTALDAGFTLLRGIEETNTGTLTYAADTGTANAIIVDLAVAPTAYVVGMRVAFKVAATNTDATTINVNSLGVRNVVRADGTALVENDVLAGQMVEGRYDGTSMRVVSYLGGDVIASAASAAAALVSENAAAASETAAAASETAAAASQGAASSSASASAASAAAALLSESAASDSETAAGLSETASAASAAAALVSKDAAAVSETNAGASETAASASEAAAGTSETNAAASESAASASETAAATSAAEALASKVAAALSEANIDTGAIADTIAATAVDVFVYDTSKDSDGGTWRDRTQNTSWYNETLNTATRGSRKDQPAVGVVGVEASTLTIYDADDPALPMWKVWDFTGFTITSVAALNGKIVVTTSTGVVVLDLIADEMGVALTYSTATTPAIVNNTVNDVAMTVLPDAPIYPATGLQIPTIAVGTDGDLTYLASVIQPDGNVYDIAADVSATCTSVSIDGTRLTVVSSTGTAYVWQDIGAIAADGTAPDETYTAASIPALLGTASLSAKSSLASSTGLTVLRQNEATPASGMIAYITSSYNTGWMVGDTLGAWLADTVAESLADTELVTNGTFDTDTAWAKEAGWTISGGVAVSTGAGRLFQDIGIEASKTYRVTFDVTAYTSGTLSVYLGNKFYGTYVASAAGSYSFDVSTIAGVNGLLYFDGHPGGSTFVGSIDNISVKRADADRSVKSNGLTVNGTLTKAPVATGAELVGYSGFSAANYLEQAYNPDLDFGTGDFCVMGWLSGGTSNPTYFDRNLSSDGVSANGGIKIIATAPGEIAGRVFAGGTNILSGVDVSGSPQFICLLRRSGIVYIYVDGVLCNSASQAGSIAKAGATTVLGNDATGSYSATGASMALWRVSATAPSAEQIAKIYEDEKFLFQANSACTIYGTSDAVTALAHDPVTDLLHAGNSDGRSDFQGLRRVANTTTPVTTAISADNKLIVEQ